MKLSILSNKIPWFGKYSGYECIDQYFPKEVEISTNLVTDSSFIKKVLGKYYQYYYSLKSVYPNVLANGKSFLREAGSNVISHALYLDANLYLIKIATEEQKKNLLGTIHLPFTQWKEQKLQVIQSLKHAILLYDSEINKFQKYLPDTQLHVIRHGVDNSFFKPGERERDRTKLLCVGHYLRNFPMLERVIGKLSAKSAKLSFHFVIPSKFRNDPALVKLSANKNVFFYEKLSDEELLKLYQTCGAMLMPMNDSGANTAIVQAIACGIPLITTNTGGITSYGGNDIYKLIDNNDDEAMTELTLTYVEDSSFSEKCSNELRKFSLQHLDWYYTAKQHVEYYYQILEQ